MGTAEVVERHRALARRVVAALEALGAVERPCEGDPVFLRVEGETLVATWEEVEWEDREVTDVEARVGLAVVEMPDAEFAVWLAERSRERDERDAVQKKMMAAWRVEVQERKERAELARLQAKYGKEG